MNEIIPSLLKALDLTPVLLKELIEEINPTLYKKELIAGKWTIHENATHIAVGDRYGFQKRLEQFKNEAYPIIEPLSGDSFPADFFISLDLKEALASFFELRYQTIELAKSFKAEDWHKTAMHPEYKEYTPYIMLRHLLMHDHAHLYKIEDMGFGIGHVK